MISSTFKEMMLRADTLRGVSIALEETDFWAGYQKGLRRLHNGENFGTNQEHDTWFSIPADERDLIRRARGEGYRAGFAGLDPVELFRAMSKAMSAKELAEAAGVTSSRIRQLASIIPGGRKTDAGWKFPESSVNWVKNIPKPGRRKTHND